MKNKNRNRYGVRLTRRIKPVKPALASTSNWRYLLPEADVSEFDTPALSTTQNASNESAKPIPPPIRVITEGEKSADE